MKPNLRWDKAKNDQLLRDRGLYFELVVEAFEIGAVIMDMQSPQKGREHQRMLLIRAHGYVCAVPYVQDGNTKFLKTMYFSRKFDALYGEKHG
ncbi:MAG: toxin [Proteobacteria bacterium]|nr:toxin [Pseudomonadota bacterium]